MVLKFSEQTYYFQKGSECSFKPLRGVSYSDFKRVFIFAYEMVLGRGHHRNMRTGGSFTRNKDTAFVNALEGKLGEVCIYREFLKNGIDIGYPDLNVMGFDSWDKADINFKNIKMSVKTSKSYSRMMLLDKRDYLVTKDGKKVFYRPDKEIVDVFLFTRMKSNIINVLKEMKNISCNDSYIRIFYKKAIIRFDSPCYINNKDVLNMINHKMILPQGAMLNGRTIVDADNYYIFINDMKPISNLYNIINKYYII